VADDVVTKAIHAGADAPLPLTLLDVRELPDLMTAAGVEGISPQYGDHLFHGGGNGGIISREPPQAPLERRR
jgi:hypothetical protein